MSTAVGGIEAGRKTLRMRVARQQREARIRFWRVFAVSSFFVVVLSANLIVGAVVVIGNMRSQISPEKTETLGQFARVKRPLLDGTFCRFILINNDTLQTIEDKVERCDKVTNQPRSRTRSQFSWGGR